MKIKPNHYALAAITAILAAGALDIALKPDPITVKLENPQQIVWDKPTTDAEWAEDVKKENLDIKSTDILNEMLVSQIQGLAAATSSLTDLINCPECYKYQAAKDNPDWTTTDINDAYTNELNTQIWLSEKITQSIERIEHELDLRARGIVIPDKKDKAGTLEKNTNLQKIAPSAVRHINN